jgi:hypothetical protein
VVGCRVNKCVVVIDIALTGRGSIKSRWSWCLGEAEELAKSSWSWTLTETHAWLAGLLW